MTRILPQPNPRSLSDEVSVERAIRHLEALRQARDRLDDDLTEAERRLRSVLDAQQQCVNRRPQ